MKYLKTLLSICLVSVLALCLVVLPKEAHAEKFSDSNSEYQYTVSDGKITLDRYKRDNKHVVVPKTIDGYPVVALGDAVYYGSAVETVTVHAGILSISEKAFYSSTNITAIWVDAGNPNYCSDANGVLFNKNKTELIRLPEKWEGSYTVPNSVTKVGAYAFYHCDWLEKVTLPAGLKGIGKSAFFESEYLTEVNLPEGLVTIGESAFSETGLSSAVSPDSVTSIGIGAFENCSGLLAVKLGDGLQKIDIRTFSWCFHLKQVEFGENITSIGNRAFMDCQELTEIPLTDKTDTGGILLFGNTEM